MIAPSDEPPFQANSSKLIFFSKIYTIYIDRCFSNGVSCQSQTTGFNKEKKKDSVIPTKAVLNSESGDVSACAARLFNTSPKDIKNTTDPERQHAVEM